MEKYLVYALIVIAIAAASFGVGWKVCDWHHDAQDLTDLKVSVKTAVAAQQAATTLLTNENQKTEGLIAQYTQSMGVQANAFNQIDTQLVSLNAGNCNFSAGANGLLDNAYQAAFGKANPTGPAKASSAGKAHGKHATTHAAKPAIGQLVPAASSSAGHGGQPAV